MPAHRFGHRNLLRSESGEPGASSSPIQAIYLCTKGRASSAKEAVTALSDLNIPVNVMASSIDDFPDINLRFPDLDIHIVRPSAFDRNSPLLTHRFSQESSRTVEWDLHVKRNSALALAKAAGLRRILLLDDDISGLKPRHLDVLAARLESAQIAGFFIEGYDDNSAIGHICRQVGFPQSSFISGSSLGIDVDSVTSMFPPLYNEDWLFMFSALAAKSVAVAGTVRQGPGEEPSLVASATFQECGDLLAEGAFSALDEDPALIYELEYWHGYLRERANLLGALVSRFSGRNDRRSSECRRAIAQAQHILDTVLPIDCVSYMRMLAEENARWATALHDGDASVLVNSVSVRPRKARFGSASTPADNLWTYPDGASVTVVCPTLPQKLRSPFADASDRNFNRSLALADLDAAIEILTSIKTANQLVNVQIRSAEELTSELLAGELVLVGGAAWNTATARFMKLMNFPVHQRTGTDEDVFFIDGDGLEVEYGPKDDGSALVEDIALFARGRNPFGHNHHVVVCNGVLSRGVLGTARAFTHPIVAADNSRWVRERSDGATYGVLLRVPVFAGEVIAPDLTRPENRIFDWSSQAEDKVHVVSVTEIEATPQGQ